MITIFKIFENASATDDIIYDIKNKIGQWLNLNKPDTWNGPEGWSGRRKLYRVDYSYYQRGWNYPGLALHYLPGRSDNFILFYIKFDNVKDNKQKELETKTKIKISTELFDYQNEDASFFMYDFLTLTLDKYAYYRDIAKIIDFYINISDFDKIMEELQDFDLYKNSKKFNI